MRARMCFVANDLVRVCTLHADGRCYRAWQAVVECRTQDCLVALSLLGSPVHEVRGHRITDLRIRGHYWLARPCNLLEVYDEDGTLLELYANVAAPPVITDGGFDVMDHELAAASRRTLS